LASQSRLGRLLRARNQNLSSFTVILNHLLLRTRRRPDW